MHPPDADPPDGDLPAGDQPDGEAPSGEQPSEAAERALDRAGRALAGGSGGSGAVRDDEVTDALPEDLNASEFVGPYTFPNNNRRRIPATIYLVLGAACVVANAVWDAGSPLVNAGVLWAGVGLVLFGAYGLVAGWTLRIDETEALSIASAQVSFAVGHASAQQVWRGWLSRPTWRILLYSAENPPARRGIVLLDGVSGEVVEWFAEDNPEDWSALDAERTKLTD